MAKDQPPFTPEQARARSKQAPKTSGTFKAGSSSRSVAGGSPAAKYVRKPGMSKDTGPNRGRNN